MHNEHIAQQQYRLRIQASERITHQALTARDKRIGAIALYIIAWYTSTTLLSILLLTSLVAWIDAWLLSTFFLVTLLLKVSTKSRS